MSPSIPTRGATRVTILPEATRDEMLAAAGLSSGANWHGIDRVPHVRDDADTDAWGDDGWDDPDTAARELEELGFVVDGGWSPADIKNNAHFNGGLTSHRGVLHAEEYVDEALLQEAVERELGFTYDEVRSVYRQGPLSNEQRELRDRIDARLLALSVVGGNMAALGRALGFKTTDATMHRIIKNALARARDEQVAA